MKSILQQAADDANEAQLKYDKASAENARIGAEFVELALTYERKKRAVVESKENKQTAKDALDHALSTVRDIVDAVPDYQ